MVKELLMNKKNVITWNSLEDMALMKPDNSPEFQTLLQEKGWQEISLRRKFLAAEPVFSAQLK